MQVRPLGHVFSPPQGGAQKMSPWNWAQMPPPEQSEPVTHSGQALEPGPDPGKGSLPPSSPTEPSPSPRPKRSAVPPHPEDQPIAEPTRAKAETMMANEV